LEDRSPRHSTPAKRVSPIANIILYFIILSTAATLHSQGVTQIESAAQAAQASVTVSQRQGTTTPIDISEESAHSIIPECPVGLRIDWWASKNDKSSPATRSLHG